MNLSQFFCRNMFEYDKRESDFKCTVSYLKFITRIFKLDYPQMLLAQGT